MARSATRMVALVAASQAVYLGFLGLCTALDPALVTRHDEGGISNFGIHAATVVPYTVAFAGAAGLLLAAASAAPLEGAIAPRFALALRALAAALLCVLVSTYAYKHAAWLHTLHIVVSIAAVIVEVAVAAWLVARLERDVLGVVALAALCAGAGLAAITLAGLAELLFVAQAATSIAFAVLLVRGAVAVVRDAEGAAR